MKRLTKLVGSIGEDIAVSYLRDLGYEILDTNFRFHKNEVDIIAKDKSLLVFIEVKSRCQNNYGSGFESITLKKQKDIIKVSKFYILKNNLQNINVRFDALSINFSNKKKHPDIYLIKDAFRIS